MSVLTSRPRESRRGGVCRYCRCTENNACILSMSQVTQVIARVLRIKKGLGIARFNKAKRQFTCSWINQQQTVCSNPSCVRKHKIHERAKKMRLRVRVRNGRQLHARRTS
jgi:hypothetical protein